jgi:hypothetical protein
MLENVRKDEILTLFRKTGGIFLLFGSFSERTRTLEGRGEERRFIKNKLIIIHHFWLKLWNIFVALLDEIIVNVEKLKKNKKLKKSIELKELNY